jgi:anti-sigma factor RsiW
MVASSAIEFGGSRTRQEMRTNGEDPTGLPDSTLWRRSRLTDAAEDEVARLLDLAGFADGRLDPDEQERVAEWLAGDPAAAADVAAARSCAAAIEPFAPAPEAVIARACALVGGGAQTRDNLVAFPPRRQQSRRLSGTVQWGSLAAAVALAAWLGFTLGIGASRTMVLNDRPAAGGLLNELLDTQTGVLGDLGEGSQT